MKDGGYGCIIENMKHVYLDNAATTRVSESSYKAMEPYFTELWANPSSKYKSGAAVRAAYERSRERVAAVLGCLKNEIIFTSSGSEANCLAIKGAARANRDRGKRLVTTAIEHASVMRAFKALEAEGFEVVYVKPGRDGVVGIDGIRAAVNGETSLVCVMYANNETGAIQPVREAARIAHEHGALFFTDAVQAAGAVKLSPEKLGADLLSLSGHKINAPKGTGALYVKTGVRLSPLTEGTQEAGLRGGTENAAFAAALAVSLEEAAARLTDIDRIARLRDALYDGIKENIPGVIFNGSFSSRLPGILNLSFEGVQSEGLIHLLDLEGIEVSSGSACNSGSDEPSHVLTAMNAPALSAVRFSLSHQNTPDDVAYTVSGLKRIVSALR